MGYLVGRGQTSQHKESIMNTLNTFIMVVAIITMLFREEIRRFLF
ncbi:hypothetical protein [Helicobacter sp. MIT 05-5294]|nr:hypothetical protein [Helicobacter sp. MIT 05-5294]